MRSGSYLGAALSKADITNGMALRSHPARQSSDARKRIGLWDVLPRGPSGTARPTRQARKGAWLGSVAPAFLELKSFNQRVEAESEVSIGLSDCELGTVAQQVGVPTRVIVQRS